MKKSLPLAFVAIIIVVIIAFALNPSPDKHREKIRSAVKERSQIESLLGVGHLKAFASKYQSIGVASYTTVDDELASIGLFGVVFIVD